MDTLDLSVFFHRHINLLTRSFIGGQDGIWRGWDPPLLTCCFPQYWLSTTTFMAWTFWTVLVFDVIAKVKIK
jgi:hypothetical protein